MMPTSLPKLILLLNLFLCNSLIHNANNKQENVMTSRRGFLASAVSAGAVLAGNQKAQAFWPFEIVPIEKKDTYEDFKALLRSNIIVNVTIGADGFSLVCIDNQNVTRSFKDLPDDPYLLAELYRRNVNVDLEEYHYEKKMNSYDWIRQKMGYKTQFTDEELYEYKGYKTYRQNFPDSERAYLPSNLITSY